VNMEQSSGLQTSQLNSLNSDFEEHSSNNQLSPALPLDLSRSTCAELSEPAPASSSYFSLSSSLQKLEQSLCIPTNQLDVENLEVEQHSSNNQLSPALPLDLSRPTCAEHSEPASASSSDFSLSSISHILRNQLDFEKLEGEQHASNNQQSSGKLVTLHMFIASTSLFDMYNKLLSVCRMYFDALPELLSGQCFRMRFVFS
jgi:hypothetical protein